MPKIYEIFPSKNRFFFGCCVTGPAKDIPGMIYIYCCSLGVVVPFCVFVVGQNWNTNPALPILFLLTVAFMYFFMYLTACSNPGIIPKRPFLELYPGKYEKYLSAGLEVENASMRSCYSCHIIKPKRTSHCSSCQNCVQIYDHHCGFLGTCIGKRNYSCIFLAICLLIVNMVVFIIKMSSNEVSQTAIIVIISVVAAVIGLPILGFLIFHLYLTIKKKTTREVLKHLESDGEDIENQWCSVDPPAMDLFDDITEEQAQTVLRKLEETQHVFQPITNTQPVPIKVEAPVIEVESNNRIE